MSSIPSNPAKDYIPKDVTQQIEFIKKYPNFDGREILMAIIDDGIDVSLDGLQKTSTGKPKIVDCFDFTGAGNVDTSVLKESENNVLIGLSGRLLKIPSTWENPSGKWHLGIRSVYENFPKSVIDKITAKRKTELHEKNKQLIQKFKDKNNSKMEEYLKSAEEDLTKISTMIADCIVWFDGQKWQACIDTSFVGDLENIKVLTNFRDEHEYGTFEGNVTYCINIYNEGNLLEIFVVCRDHGSCVAQIAAAHFPDDSERDGLAPGAQIVSMNIYDPRLNNHYINDALELALNKCIEMGVQIVNYSISGFHKKAHKIIKEMVEKHGIIIVKSSGNDGPTYFSSNTYNKPIWHNLFVIGSILTPTMRETLYNAGGNDEKDGIKVFSYSSRGPSKNGSHCVDFVAPGAAIVEVSKFNDFNRKYFDGTSAAAPNASGVFACLLSALKKTSTIQFSPKMIKFALEQTAFLPANESKLEFGHGIIQINAAFDYCRNSTTQLNSIERPRNTVSLYRTYNGDYFELKKCKFRVKLFPGASKILRKLLSKKQVLKFLNVTYNEVKGIVHQQKESKEKTTIWVTVFDDTILDKNEINLKLISSNAIFKNSKIKNEYFTVTIDSSLLEAGSLNFAEIQAFHPSFHGPIFHLPITVISPLKITEEDNNYSITKELEFKPGGIHRIFFHPPKYSYDCCIKLTSLDPTIPNTTISVHYTVEKCDISSFRYYKRYLKFSPSNKSASMSDSIYVYNNYLHEICFVQDETILSVSKFKAEIDFLGICITSSNPTNFTLKNYLKPFSGCVVLKIKKISYLLKATNLEFVSIKNSFQNSSKNRLILIYDFKVSMTSKVFFKVDRNYRYYEAKVFTAAKKVVHQFRNRFPPDTITLPPGSYFVALLVEKKFILLKLLSAKYFPTVTVTVELKDSVTPNLYSKTEKTEESKISKDTKISLIKNEECVIHYDFENPSDLPNPLSFPNANFHGHLHFSYGEIENEISNFEIYFSQKHSFDTVAEKNDNKNVKEKFKDIFQPFLPYSLEMKKLFSLINSIEASKLEAKIYQFYSTNNYEQLLSTIDLYFKIATNHTWFLQSCENVKTTVSKHEQEIIEKQKNAIMDILFIKADTILNEFLKEETSNVPTIFKENFGFEYLKNKLQLKKSFGLILQNAVSDFFKNTVFSCFFNNTESRKEEPYQKIEDEITVMKESKKAAKEETPTTENAIETTKCQNCCLSTDSSEQLENSSSDNNITTLNYSKSCECNISSSNNAILNPSENAIDLLKVYDPQQAPALTDSQKQLEKACTSFLEHASESDIRKDLILIKKALVFADFGSALFLLNKISTTNRTIPDFKFIDLAIAELLKHLGWNHLSEAHQNSIFDHDLFKC